MSANGQTGETLHATLVVWRGAGLLLTGSSGAGKSDLALRLIEAGGVLVADDYVVLSAGPEGLTGRPPPSLAGRLEVRGVGVVQTPHHAQAGVDLVVALQLPGEIERLPEAETRAILGVDLPLVRLCPFDVSAVAKLGFVVAAKGRLPVIKESLADAAAPPPAGSQSSMQTSDSTAPPVVLVTGMSGAGRSTALKVLEDLGYEAIDNLPLDLMNALMSEGAITRPLAIGMDTRSRNFDVPSLLEQVERLIQDTRVAATLLFLDCEDAVLQRRFTETRRIHPLAQGRPLADGLRAERRLVERLRQRADLVIDTSDLAPPDLRRLLTGHLAVGGESRLTVFVTSFSYKKGLPREADLVFDVRFLDNPHYDPALQPLTGRDARVAAHVEADPDFPAFFERLTGMLAALLPRYRREGKSYLTIAIGCTGGRHRSVAIAERLTAWLTGEDWPATVGHRDLNAAEGGASNDPPPLHAGDASERQTR